MANQPHPDKHAVTWRLHRNLLASVQSAAKQERETALAFATRALKLELVRLGYPNPDTSIPQDTDASE